MINVNQMTSQLARMPDQALQQYAQMHKHDPYIMSLAVTESNRRKTMRTAAQMDAPEELKVNDQAIQSMAPPMPEDVGIGQLPAPNMQRMAEGGIVAFSDGGDVPRYQSGGVLDAARARAQAAQQKLYTYGLRQRLQDTSGFIAAEKELSAAQNALQAAEQQYQAEMSATGAGRAAFGRPTAETSPIALPKAMPEPSAAETAMAMNAGAFKPPPAPPAPPPAAPKVAAAKPPVAPAAQSSPQAEGIARLPLMQSPSQMYLNAQEAVPLVDPAGGMREDLGKEMISGAESRAKKLKDEIAGEGDVFAGRGARIGKREEKLKSYESTNQSLALLNAGLAIMSTPGGLATAIGKGARVGTEQYAAGLDKIRAAQERIEEARDNLDTLRLNRSDMNKKEIRAVEADIDRAKVDAKKMGIEGLMAASDLRQKQASDLYKGMVEQDKTRYTGGVDLLGREMSARASIEAARISAGAPLALLRAVAADPKLQAVYGKGQGGQDKIMGEYADFLKANPRYMADEAAGIQAFLRAKGALSSLSGAGAAGSVSGTPTGKVLQ